MGTYNSTSFTTNMKSIRSLLLIPPCLLALTTVGLYAADCMTGHEHHAQASELTDAQMQLLSGYEIVRAALAVDNLGAAKTAAERLLDAPAAVLLVKADSLDSARAAFKKLSDQVVPLARGHAGYYVAHCSMANSDWVQTSTEINNPYLGVKMPTCGTIVN